MAVLRTVGDHVFDAASQETRRRCLSGAISAAQWCLAIAMAAVDLGTGLARLKTLGWKPFCVGFVETLLVAWVSVERGSRERGPGSVEDEGKVPPRGRARQVYGCAWMALPGGGTCWAFLYAVIQFLLPFPADAIGWCSRHCDSSLNGKRLARDVDPRPGP